MIRGTLRHLPLVSFEVDWTTLVESGSQVDIGFENLRSLYLSSLKPPPPATFLNRILSSSPHLKKPRINNTFPVDFSPSFRLPNPAAFEDLFIQSSFDNLTKTFLWMMSTCTLSNLQGLRLLTMRLDNQNPPHLSQIRSSSVKEVFSH